MPRRPKTIWITQIILLIVGVPFCLLLLLTLLGDAAYLFKVDLSLSLALSFLLSVVLRLGLVVLFAAAFWGLVKRKKYGRWLTVAILVLVTLASIYGQVFKPSGPLEYYDYENEAQQMGGIFANVIIYGLIAFLFYRLVFGESVTDFFQETPDENQTPPPPPEFNQGV